MKLINKSFHTKYRIQYRYVLIYYYENIYKNNKKKTNFLFIKTINRKE